MSSALSSTLASIERADRRHALRYLLRHPLVSRTRDEEIFVLIVRHRRWLTDWYADRVRWRLEVDNAAGFARLHKVPARSDGSRSARLGSGKPPFTRRRYVLLCLTLAALDDCGAQTTLASLAELVAVRSLDDPGVESFDAAEYGERRAFVDVLNWLTDAGVVALRDGDVDRYASSGSADALYDVDDRLLGQLISAPVPPALATDRAHRLHEPYAETEEGERQNARHAVLRRLIDDPAVYLEDLTQSQRDWLEPSRSFVYRLLKEDVGMVVERRSEGLAAIDPDGSVTDVLFPDGASTVKHAALLLGEHLVEQARSFPGRAFVMSDIDAIAVVRDLIGEYGDRCGWKKEYMGDEHGAERLTDDVLQLLAGFGLVRRVVGDRVAREGGAIEGKAREGKAREGASEGWQPRPALARFAPLPPDVDSANWGN